MKTRILLIIGMFVFALGFSSLVHSNAFGACIENIDWPQKPCLDTPPYSLEEQKQAMAPYYDYKGSEWMKGKKSELIQSLENGTFREWTEAVDDFSHWNVYEYYNVFEGIDYETYVSSHKTVNEFDFEIWPTESIVRYPEFPTIEFTLTPAPSGPFESFYLEDIDEQVPENRLLVVYKITTPDGNIETSIGHFHLEDITQHLTKDSVRTPVGGEYSIKGTIFWQTDKQLFSFTSNTITITAKDPTFRGNTEEISIDKKLGGVELFDWSADGNLILFRYVENFGTDNWQHRLATMTPDGNNIVVLPISGLTYENRFYDARFSPDGNIHVYMDDRNLYQFERDTKKTSQLTHQKEIHGFDYYHYDEDRPENYSIIVIVENEDTLENREDYMLLDIGNGKQENSILDAHALVFDFPSHQFDISPDGKKILFKKTIDAGYGGANRVLAYMPAQGDVVEIPNIQTSCGSNPQWSPNGEMIIYHESSCGRGAPGGTLHLTNLDGSYHEILVPYTNYNPSNFIINPDGSSIIYGVDDKHNLKTLTLSKTIPEFGGYAMIVLVLSMVPVFLARNKLVLR